MMSSEVPTWISGVLSVTWFALEVAVAAAALYRFRSTASGLLLSGAFLVMALLGATVTLLNLSLLREAAWDSAARMTVTFGQSAISLLVGIAVAVGIVLIPNSLRQLNE